MSLDPGGLEDLVALWRAGSLSGAAKRRGVAVSTIARRLEGLETALKLALVDRRASGSLLTPDGARIAALSEPLSEQLSRVERAAEALRAGSQTLPVRVSATEFVISDVLAPALNRLLDGSIEFPVHLQSQADVVSLAARNADIAVRMARPEGASLIVRRLPELRIGLFGLRGSQTVDPSTPLNARRLFCYDESYGRIPELQWAEQSGLAGNVAMRTASTRALLNAARSGAGIAMLPAAIANRYDDLVEVPTATAIPPRAPWLIVHRDLHRQPAIRKVGRWIVECFAALVKPRAS